MQPTDALPVLVIARFIMVIAMIRTIQLADRNRPVIFAGKFIFNSPLWEVPKHISFRDISLTMNVPEAKVLKRKKLTDQCLRDDVSSLSV
ncbi:hypothetical protein [Leptolyngbya sp. 7M]|uniref:hypothetical protein n=1 Tax=Leptolyngbya sp. 7M TaxID=2812896 RepID=UPI001B8BFFC5|nr:hypothetical protein [Leptolyngbya sp. 7M]QYO62549.1 hypothetical protein JVX88_21110 [Leptolyngbya sp. 7M]